MNFNLAMIIAILFLVLSMMIIIIIRPYVKLNTEKKFLLHICDIVFVIGIAIYFSFLFCAGKGEHLNSDIVYTEYPVQKLTLNNVWFNDKSYSLEENYVVLEDYNDQYENVVIVETERYTMQWICKVNVETYEYHIYLSEELSGLYNRLQDGIIYEYEK